MIAPNFVVKFDDLYQKGLAIIQPPQAQYSAMQQQLAAEKEEVVEQLDSLQLKCEDLQRHLRNEQAGREEDEVRSADMLKEVQLLVANERSAKDAAIAKVTVAMVAVTVCLYFS